MFVVANIPICDLRSFAPDGGVLARPTWPTPGEKEFIRSFGPVRERRRSAPFPSVWADEQFFADASSVIKFDLPNVNEHLRAQWAPAPSTFRVVYRRLFCGPTPLRRIEIGLKIRIRRHGLEDDGQAFRSLQESLFGIPVRVRGFGVDETRTDLLDGLRTLKDRYASSTYPAAAKCDHLHLVIAGAPLFIFESGDEDWHIKPGKEYRCVPFSGKVQKRLAFWDFRVGSTRRGHVQSHVWHFSPHEFRSHQERSVRSSLARLHAERQVLHETLNAVAKGSLDIHPDSAETQTLCEYLERAIGFVRRDKINRMPQAELRELITLHEQAIEPARVQTLIQQFEKQSASIARKIELAYPERAGIIADRIEQVNIVGGGVAPEVITIISRSQNVNNKVIRIGDGNEFFAPLTIADTIENSFNAVRELPKDDERRMLIETLGKQVAELGSKMPDQAEAEAAARKLETLSKEASSKKPDMGLMEISGKGLIEAAKTVADMAAPIARTVKTLLQLFAIAV